METCHFAAEVLIRGGKFVQSPLWYKIVNVLLGRQIKKSLRRQERGGRGGGNHRETNWLPAGRHFPPSTLSVLMWKTGEGVWATDPAQEATSGEHWLPRTAAHASSSPVIAIPLPRVNWEPGMTGHSFCVPSIHHPPLARMSLRLFSCLTPLFQLSVLRKQATGQTLKNRRDSCFLYLISGKIDEFISKWVILRPRTHI